MGLIEQIKQLSNNQVILGAISVYFAAVIPFLLKDIPTLVLSFLDKHLTTTMTITSQNQIYHKTLKFFEVKYKNKGFRRIKLTNGWWGESEEIIKSIGYGFHFFIYNKRPIFIWLYKDEKNESIWDKEYITIKKIGRSQKLLDKMIIDFEEIEKESDKLEVFKMQDAGWFYCKKINKRKKETIFLETKTEKILFDSLRAFKGKEKWYLENGINYQYGILLHGPPGTGKTSLIKTIASELNLPIYYVSAMDVTKLHLATPVLPNNCVLVIEDIDSSKAANKRKEEEEEKSITEQNNEEFKDDKKGGISEILNALDGIFSSHGRVLVMTTNCREKLDPALIRPGRVDLDLLIPLVTKETLIKFLKKHFPNENIEINKIKEGLSIAKLQNLVMLEKSCKEIIEECEAKENE